ncbi:hydrogenase expression/formation protein HupJ [Methylosinus sp. C49]|uniref:[NiFe]-hydrogenase assembly chaperone HybE n=1 Tax=Methylosinus sp. C49 TaxID=2699395 RepID=UPI001367494B|nr:[NiFe]-hydrogenase assembly chaperone HybE [Methylosinus sp. C49]BBU60203.1 hydrogenase expression/formation protein HupJ [Methylosinus sp. C49]
MRELSDAAARGEKLADFYRRVHATSMRDSGLCNEALEVEPVGFRDFGPYALGVIVTPWFANLVVAAPREGAEAPFPDPARLQLRFPAGDVDFNVSEIDGFGRIAACSLFSPMDDFADHDAACTAARAALDALLDPALNETPKREPEPANALDRRALFGGRRRGDEEASP